MSFDRRDVVRLEKPNMGNSRLVIYCTPDELRRDNKHLQDEMRKMRARNPQIRPPKVKASIGVASANKGILEKEALKRLRKSKSGPVNVKPLVKRSSVRTPVKPLLPAFSDVNLAKLQERGLLATKRPKHKLASSSDLEMNSLDPLVLSALVLLQSVLDKNMYGLMELLKRSEFYSTIKDLTAVELKHVLKKECSGEFALTNAQLDALAHHLDKYGDGHVDVTKLMAYLRLVKCLAPGDRDALKRGAEFKRPHVPTTSQRRVLEVSPIEKKKGRCSPVAPLNDHPDTLFEHSLLELDRFLQLRRLRIIDLFRGQFNSNAKKEGDIILTHTDFEKVLHEAGVRLSNADIDNIVWHVDADHNEEVSVEELDRAIKKAKRRRRGGADALTRLTTMSKQDSNRGADMKRLRAQILKSRMHPTTQP